MVYGVNCGSLWSVGLLVCLFVGVWFYCFVINMCAFVMVDLLDVLVVFIVGRLVVIWQCCLFCFAGLG